MKPVLLIEHLDDGPEPDRVRLFLERAGRPYTVVRPYLGDAVPQDPGAYSAAVLYGGAQEAYQTDLYPYLADEHAFCRAAVAASLPTLGLCLGAQLIAHAHGATVAPRSDGAYEFGYYTLTPTQAGRAVFPDAPVMPQWHWHNATLPAGAELLASSPLFANQAYRLGSAWGFQFHAEVTAARFRHWQALPSAPWTAPGAQTRAEQDRLMATHDAAIDRWFNVFLGRFLG